MNKSELLSTYAAEQLAEMVVTLEIILAQKENTEQLIKQYKNKKDNHSGQEVKIIAKCPDCGKSNMFELDEKSEKILRNKLTDSIHELEEEVEKYRKAFEEAKKERDCQVAEYQKKIGDLEHDLKISREKIQDLASVNMNLQCERNDYKSKAETLEIESRRIDTNKSELERAKNTINQIDDILERLFGVRHDMVGKPDEFEKILTDRAKGNVTDFLPTEPIKVAEMLISAEGEYKHNPIVKKICGTDKGTYRIFEVSELRQIAEHLLVYCNHNGEAEE